MKIATYVITLLLGGFLGWKLHSNQTIQTVTQVDPLVGILRQALAKVSAHDVAVTDSARVALDSFKVYKNRNQSLRESQQRAETVFVAATHDSTISKDSTAALCSVVINTCEERADVAEREAQSLRDRLAAQVTLQPKRVSLGLFGGLGYDVRRKKVGPIIGAGVLYRLR